MSMPAQSPLLETLIDAILPHVAFDGWSDQAFEAAILDAKIDPVEARTLCPRGPLDLAVAFHKAGDAAMVAAVEAADLASMRYSEQVAFAVRARLSLATEKEAVRRATSMFALPHMAPEGAALIWGTADAIWNCLGDTSTDGNWYSKRATLSAVYASTVLFWLGDDSIDGQATDEFVSRRIENVMQFEKVKSQVNAIPLLKPITGPLSAIMAGIKPPQARNVDRDLPGRWMPTR